MIPPLGATIDGTGRYFRRLQKRWMHEEKVRSLCEWTIPAMAIGTYLGHYDSDTDALYTKTLETALEMGINFIDTSINYRCQRSEKTIGRVLAKLIQLKKLARDEVVISTKGGFIPFLDAPAPSLKKYIEDQFITPGILTADDIVANCHSLAPRFIDNQISTSLRNLNCETVDVYYLHNPETQLPHVGENVFYEKIEKAFHVLEENVDKGKIQYYGLATWNGFRAPVLEALNLNKLYQIAVDVGGADHHFKALQMPYNLAMREASVSLNQKVGDRMLSTLTLANDLGLQVMASSPLLQTQVLQKGDAFFKKIPGNFTPVQKALQFVESKKMITSVMSGIKLLAHLKENMAVLEKENWTPAQLKEITTLL
ncbi:aldo/keto reductase [bacterium]|nr:aldo/keto reductase [bacterium]